MSHETNISAEHPEGLTDSQERLATQLFDLGVVRFGEFKLKLHELHPEVTASPIYMDLRMLRRNPVVKAAAVEVYQELISSLEFDLLADVPTAATPIVSSLSDRLGIGMITPRTDSKSHGTGAKIDGLLPEDKNKKVIVIDDLVTKADSKIEAVGILKEQGLIVTDVVVLIDREQGGRRQLQEQGLNLHSALTLPQLLNFYQRIGKITTDQYQDINNRLQAMNKFLGIF